MARQYSIKPLYVFIAIAIASIAAVCSTSVFCGYFYFSLRGFGEAFSGCSPSNITELENAGQFKLPTSAKNLKSGCFGMQGWDGHADFVMSPSELDTFIASTKVKPPLSPNEMPKDSDLVTLASQTKSYLHGRYDSYVPKADLTFYQEVLVDTSNPGQYQVYIRFGGG